MRLGFGLALLGLGVAGLGFWARGGYAPRMQAQISTAAQEVVSGSVHGVQTEVVGRDIYVTGLADGAAERTQILEVLDGVTGRRVVVDGLEVLPTVTPYTFSAAWNGETLSTRGHAPTAAAMAQMEAVGAADLTMAAGAPDAQWPSAAVTAMGALTQMEHGAIELSGHELTVTGMVQTLDHSRQISDALFDMPDEYVTRANLSVLDDGSPPAYSLAYAADTGLSLEGKLPRGVTRDAVAEAFGLADIAGEASTALTGDEGRVSPVFAAMAPWLHTVEALDISVTEADTRVIAGFGAGTDHELLAAALQNDLDATGETVSLRVVDTPATGEEGAVRTNARTGQSEVLASGYWVPQLEFETSLANCEMQADDVLRARRIGFVTGSARLNATAQGAVNALAGVMRHCTMDGALRAEIGGHTDSTGSEEGNMALSLARAQAVREALLARGIAADALTAEGYGPSQPIADNATEEGRAANRRTAIRWIE